MKPYKILTLFLIFVGLPLAFYFVGDFPRRSLLKEAISVVTIVSFFIMLMQFFLSGYNKRLNGSVKKSTVIRWHKVLGYSFITVLLLHPFLIVFPQSLSEGMRPTEAFLMIMGEWSSDGIIMGMVAWCLMLLLGLTSFFRKQLKMKYADWRLLHSIIAVVFIIIAALHVVSLGRHINVPIDVLIAVLTAGVLGLTFRAYVKPVKTKSHE